MMIIIASTCMTWYQCDINTCVSELDDWVVMETEADVTNSQFLLWVGGV